jgi:hypothetical protein
MNNPFKKDDEHEFGINMECEEEISLETAKKMIPDVSYVKFREKCHAAMIADYLQDAYYMHYLCLIGDITRIKNFVMDLENRELDPTKVCNYPLLAEFDYGTCIQTLVMWNNDVSLYKYFKNELEADVVWQNKFGLSPFDVNYPYQYTNPFWFLGDGEIPMDRFKIYICKPKDFKEMRKYMLKEFHLYNQDSESESESEEEEEELDERAYESMEQDEEEHEQKEPVRKIAKMSV